MVQFHSPPEPSPSAPDLERDPFPAEEPTRPSTPSSLHPYRAPGRAPEAPIPTHAPSPPTLTPGLVSLLERIQGITPPQRPLVDPWWRAIVRLVLGE